jgi:hypothetical protein
MPVIATIASMNGAKSSRTSRTSIMSRDNYLEGVEHQDITRTIFADEEE